LTTTTSPKKETSPTLRDALRILTSTTSQVAGLDLETTSKHPRNGEIRLAQIGVDGHTFVIDLFKIRSARAVFEALASLEVVLAHNAAFEYSWIYAKYGICLDNLRDTFLLARLASRGDMSVECGLGPVVERELGITLDKEIQVSDWSSPELTPRQLEYAAEDAAVLRPLNERLTQQVFESKQEEIAEIENAAVGAVGRMLLEGTPFDHDGWVAHARQVEEERDALALEMLDSEWMPQRDPVPQRWQLQGEDCLEMLRAAGLEVEGADAKALKDHAEEDLVAALLEYRKIKGDPEARDAARERVYELAPTKPPAPAPLWNLRSADQVLEISTKVLGFTPKNTAEATLLRYVDQHPFFRAMLKYRKLSTLTSKYGENWTCGAYDESTGRIYPGWRQCGTETGRFSCAAPNVQQIPRDGPYRSFFRAPEGRTFVAADFSQIEVRVYAKLVDEGALLDVFDAGGDVYRSTAAKLMDKEENEVTKEERQKAKAVLLGIFYGLSAYGLPEYAFKSYSVIIAPDEAEELIETFFKIYPAVEADHRKVEERLKKRGYVNRKTVLGRRRDKITRRNEGINYPVQASSADGLKSSLGSVYQRLGELRHSAFIIGAFHDELLVECDEGDAERVARIITGAMVSSMERMLMDKGRNVPIKVDVTIGPVWAKE
jgi:DNA polymerase-1